ncbi:MAG: hypothetical protein M0R51_13200, partial [Clostridia bacterium]|nr:hypothetical protein [Clostridia bacterium]
MSIAVYFYDLSAKLIKQGSLTVSTTEPHYTFSETEVSIQQGDIGSHTIMAVFPDGMFTAGNTGIYASFVAPNGNSNKLIPGEYQTSYIAGYPISGETTFVNCALFVLDTAFYTYVAGRYLFAVGMVDSTTGPIKKTALGNYIVDNGIDNFDENSLTASDYDNLLTAITNLTAGFGADIDALETGKQDATIRFDDAYLGVTIQTDIFPATSGEETVMGKIEVARDINPATISDIPTIIYFHGVVVNTAGVLSMKANSGKAIVFGKAINGTGVVGFSATGMWVWIPISDNVTK